MPGRLRELLAGEYACIERPSQSWSAAALGCRSHTHRLAGLRAPASTAVSSRQLRRTGPMHRLAPVRGQLHFLPQFYIMVRCKRRTERLLRCTCETLLS